MKRSIILPLLALVLYLWLPADSVGGETARVVLRAANGPVAVSYERVELRRRAVDLPGTPWADGEGALRLLVNGTKDHASYFPAGTTLDRVTADAAGYVLYLTFPAGFAHDGDETITDPLMHALAETMRSVAPGRNARLLVRDDPRDGYRPIGELFKAPAPIGPKPYEAKIRVGPPGFSQPRATGFLSGKSIFLAPGHGWYYNDSEGAWLTQRPNTNGIVEDFSNPEAVLQYLQPYFHNAGALVYTVRERDMNTAMEIIDNNDAGCAAIGGWWASTASSGYYGDDYLVAEVSSTETATATFTGAFPADGYYHVYVWYTGGTNRATDALFTVRHADGASAVRLNLQRDGFTWKDLGRYYFLADDPPKRRQLVVSNQGGDPTTFVVADAVRFGGGMHEDAAKPRWEMSGLYHAPFMGCADCATNTVTTMPRYTKWEHESWEDGLYLSWHTNAPDPGTGTSTFAYSSYGWDGAFNGVEGSLDLRSFVHNEIINDIRAGWDAAWTDRGQHTNWYGEINPNYNDETPGIIFEVAFHDTPDDAEQLKEPGFRQLVARAVYQAVVRYYANRDGLTPRFLPEPPLAPSVVMNDEGPLVSWNPPIFDHGGTAGDAAESYRLYLSRSGKGVTDAIDEPGTAHKLARQADDSHVVYLRIAALNEGGESFPTETLAVSTGTGPRVLIVNGFDRLDKNANVPEDYYGGGTIYRGYLQRMNSYDYVIAHAKALAAAGVDFDSASNEAVTAGKVDLNDYPAVVWIVGEDSADDHSFSTAERRWLTEYLDNGGALFVSGAEIGWDLWECGTDSERAFYTDYLRAQYQADTSGVGEVIASGLFAGIDAFTFDYLDYLIYAANWPDAIAAVDGSTDLQYAGTEYGAAVVADTGTFKVVYLGFPFETIFAEDTRAQLMAAAMDFLLPAGDDDTFDDDTVDDDDTIDDDDTLDDDFVNDDFIDDDAVDDDAADDDDDNDNDNDDNDDGCGC